MIFAYKVLAYILWPFLLLFVFLRIFINKEDPKRFKEKIFPSCFNVLREKNLKDAENHALRKVLSSFCHSISKIR